MNKIIKRLLIGVLVVLVGLVTAFFIYMSNYYRTDIAVVDAFTVNKSIETSGDYTLLKPSESSDTALIFYPGAKVEYTAYLPLLSKLQKNNIACVLVKMPFNFAIFNKNAAENAYKLLPEIKHWYIGGHSMGGAMASDYASSNKDKVDGLILLGAYVYGDYKPKNAITIYGSEDHVINLSNIKYTQNVVVIKGGNHAQFGNYGKQDGDGTATISSEEQQNLTVSNIVKFIKSKQIK